MKTSTSKCPGKGSQPCPIPRKTAFPIVTQAVLSRGELSNATVLLKKQEPGLSRAACLLPLTLQVPVLPTQLKPLGRHKEGECSAPARPRSSGRAMKSHKQHQPWQNEALPALGDSKEVCMRWAGTIFRGFEECLVEKNDTGNRL